MPAISGDEIKVAESGVALTDRQLNFCHEYVIDWNGKRAAIAAGYDPKWANELAYKTIRNENVQTHIKWLKGRTAELAGISMLRNAKELAKIAYSNVSDLKSNWEEVKNWDELTEEQKSIISEIVINETYSKNGDCFRTIKFKLHDKVKAIEMINKMFGYNAPDKLDVKTTLIDWTD